MDNKIIKNYIYNIIFQVVSIITPFITAPYVARVLGAYKLGTYSYVSAITAFFVMFANLGFNVFGQKEIAYYQCDIMKRSKVFFEIQIKKLITVLASISVYYFWTCRNNEYELFFKINSILIFATLFDVSYFFQGLELFNVTVLRGCIVKLLCVLGIFIFVRDSEDIVVYAVLQCVLVLAGNISLCINVKRYISKEAIKQVNLLENNRVLLELFVPVISVQMYFSIDKVMLGYLCIDKAESGYYDQAIKIVRICQTVITSIGGVLISSISRMISENSRNNIEDTICNAIKWGAFFACPMIAGLLALSKTFVPFFLGADFAKTAIIMMIMSPILLFSSISNVISNGILVPTNRHNLVSIITMLAAGVNVFLNYILIPKYLSVGAAIASVFAELTVLVVGCLYSKKDFSFKKITIELVTYIFAGIVMFVAVCLLNTCISFKIDGIAKTGVLGGMGCFIYFGILYIRKDVVLFDILNNTFRKRNKQ